MKVKAINSSLQVDQILACVCTLSHCLYYSQIIFPYAYSISNEIEYILDKLPL